MTKTLDIYLIIINLAAFAAFGIDKLKAKHGLWRIPEKTLLLLAVCGGAAGAFIGMRIFHHKISISRKPVFAIGVPVMLILQLAVLGYISL